MDEVFISFPKLSLQLGFEPAYFESSVWHLAIMQQRLLCCKTTSINRASFQLPNSIFYMINDQDWKSFKLNKEIYLRLVGSVDYLLGLIAPSYWKRVPVSQYLPTFLVVLMRGYIHSYMKLDPFEQLNAMLRRNSYHFDSYPV